MIKLGDKCTDRATGIVGTITHLEIGMDNRKFVYLQPKALSEEGQPVGMWLAPVRLIESESEPEFLADTKDLPMDVLGTDVEDTVSGFKGMAIGFMIHLNGCLHVNVQPRKLLCGKPVKSHDFDLRRLVGKTIPVLTQEEIKASEKETPSPEPVEPYQHSYVGLIPPDHH